MIILFSIFILFFLIFIGLNNKEGMTLTNSSLLINYLDLYYSKKTSNSNNNISNVTNENSTIDSIQKLNLTDPSFVSILNNSDIENSSKINLIKTMIHQNISQNNKDSISINTFVKMIPFVSINNPTDIEISENIRELKNLSYNDSRFNSLFVGDNPSILNNILAKMINLINPF